MIALLEYNHVCKKYHPFDQYKKVMKYIEVEYENKIKKCQLNNEANSQKND